MCDECARRRELCTAHAHETEQLCIFHSVLEYMRRLLPLPEELVETWHIYVHPCSGLGSHADPRSESTFVHDYAPRWKPQGSWRRRTEAVLASTREGTKQHSLGLYWASLQIFQGSSSNILRSYCASRPRSAYLVDRGRSSGPTTQWIRREGGDCEVKQGVSFESAGAWFHEQAV